MIEHENFYITHEKIRNALNIAMIGENKTSKLFFSLFKNLEKGKTNQLQEEYDKNVLECYYGL